MNMQNLPTHTQPIRIVVGLSPEVAQAAIDHGNAKCYSFDEWGRFLGTVLLVALRQTKLPMRWSPSATFAAIVPEGDFWLDRIAWTIRYYQAISAEGRDMSVS